MAALRDKTRSWLRRAWTDAGALGAALWTLGVLLAAVYYVQRFLWPEVLKLFQRPPDLTFALVLHSLTLLLLLGVLRWAYLALQRVGAPAPATRPRGAGEAFPSPTTKVVAVWLGLFVLLSVAGTLLATSPPSWPRAWRPLFQTEHYSDLNEALAMLFGAGIGSAITTGLAFFRHASAEKNFDRAWAPWYVARPVMGMLLGLIFYFLIKGGLWSTVGNEAAVSNLNEWSLAGIGALVGLFSHQAIEKLRELFHVLFRVEPRYRMGDGAGLSTGLAGLPESARKKLVSLLPEAARNSLAAGDEADAESVLAALGSAEKQALLEKAPAEAKGLLVSYLYPTEPGIVDRFRALPETARQEVVDALPDAGKHLHAGDEEEARKALAAVDAATRTKLLGSVSGPAKEFLAHAFSP